MIRNLTPRLAETANENALAMTGLQREIDSLAKVILENCIALDYILAQESRIYAIGDTAETENSIDNSATGYKYPQKYWVQTGFQDYFLGFSKRLDLYVRDY